MGSRTEGGGPLMPPPGIQLMTAPSCGHPLSVKAGARWTASAHCRPSGNNNSNNSSSSSSTFCTRNNCISSSRYSSRSTSSSISSSAPSPFKRAYTLPTHSRSQTDFTTQTAPMGLLATFILGYKASRKAFQVRLCLARQWHHE